MPSKSELRKFRDENNCRSIEEARMLWKLKVLPERKQAAPIWFDQVVKAEGDFARAVSHMLRVPEGFKIGCLYRDKLTSETSVTKIAHAIDAAVAQMKEHGEGRVSVMVCAETSLPDVIVYDPAIEARISKVWEIEPLPTGFEQLCVYDGYVNPLWKGWNSVKKHERWARSTTVGEGDNMHAVYGAAMTGRKVLVNLAS